MQFAVAHFALSKPWKKTGKTRLAILQDIQRQTGIVADELKNLPTVPPTMEYIWKWFLDVHRKRQAGFSMNAFSWSDVKAYFELRNLRPSRWELDAFLHLDDAYVESQSGTATGAATSAKGLSSFISGQKKEKE